LEKPEVKAAFVETTRITNIIPMKKESTVAEVNRNKLGPAKRTTTVTKQAVVSSKVKQEITIRELEESTAGSVFAVNNSPRSHRGDILFSTPKMHGNGIDAVRVVKTWIPQDLTEQVTKQQLLNSSEFRKTVSKGLIRLINPEYADVVLASDDARAEQQRIANARSASQNIMRAANLTSSKDEKDNLTPTQKRRQANLAAADEDNADRAPNMDSSESPFDVMINSLTTKSETEVLNALRNEGELTRKELKKVAAVFEHFPRVQKFCEKKLGSL
jgi:hypothetical protein